MQQAATVRAPGAILAEAATAAAGAARVWTVGQVLAARVLEVTPSGSALVQVGGEQVEARTGLALSPGQNLRLQVDAPGPPAVLRVVADPAAASTETLAAQVLRTALPRQQPLAHGLATLAALAAQPRSGDGEGDLPPAARAMISDLLASLPRPRDAGDAGRLAAMVRTCGLFHEAEQARASATASRDMGGSAGARSVTVGADFKARVAAVAEALQRSTDNAPLAGAAREAHEALHGTLARIETNQALSARGSSGEHAALWRADLPLADEHGPQEVALRIHRDGPRPGESPGAADASWVVELVVQPPGAGALHARVTLTGGAVHTLFTTEDAGLLARLRQDSGELERRLAEAELTVGGVRCRHGAPPRDTMALPASALVQERA